MIDIDADVERVRKVAEKLGAPREFVYVARWQNRNGDGFTLFASKEGARRCLLGWLDEEREGLNWSEEDFATTRAAIEAGEIDHFDDEGDRWYSIEEEPIQP